MGLRLYVLMRVEMQIDDRSLVWNTDLIETLELQNCLDNAMITMFATPPLHLPNQTPSALSCGLHFTSSD